MFNDFESLLNKHFGKSFASVIMKEISGSDFILFCKRADKYAEEQTAKIKQEYKENYLLTQVLEKLNAEKIKQDKVRGK